MTSLLLEVKNKGCEILFSWCLLLNSCSLFTNNLLRKHKHVQEKARSRMRAKIAITETYI